MIRAAAVSAALFLPCAHAQMTTATLLSHCAPTQDDGTKDLRSVYCHAYLTGLVDALAQEHGASVCVPSGVTPSQVGHIFRKYAADNPESLHLPVWPYFARHLGKTYPCKK